MKEYIITAENEGQRLDKFLKRLLPNAGSSFLYKMLRVKNIVLNSGKASGSEHLKEGDSVRIYFSDETFEKFSSVAAVQREAFGGEQIVFEDDNLVIVNKPAGMLSQKGKEDDVSACEYLTGYLLNSGSVDESSFALYKPSPVNRLDRNTSGLLICAKNLKAAQELSELLRSRELKKEYLCVVKGRVSGDRTLKAYLLKDHLDNKVRIFSDPADAEKADLIETAYKVLDYSDELDATLLIVHLITGRSHQIRAHLSYIGHPIAGDPKYGDRQWNRELKERFSVKRQLLHSFRVTFPRFNPEPGDEEEVLKDKKLLGYLSGRSFTAAPEFGIISKYFKKIP